MNLIIQHTQHMATEHPIECIILCVASVALTVAVETILRYLLR